MTGAARRGRRAMLPMATVPAVLAASLIGTAPSDAQSVLGTSPNVRTQWTLSPWATAFSIGHRFEFISGGNELLNVPTLSLGIGLPARLAFGLDFTSNSEIVPARLGGNEIQLWLSAPPVGTERVRIGGLLAYNSAASGIDAAVTGRLRLRTVTLLAEARGYQNAFGTRSTGSAGALGAILHLTPLLELSGDVGRTLDPDTLSTVWSAGIALAIPGTPHSLSLHATNGGAVTLQGASRPKVIGPQAVRYGFVFTAPLGSRRQWARIFRRDAAVPSADTTAAVTVDMRLVAYSPAEVRIRAGESVAWTNSDPIDHTVTADDGSWDSGDMAEGARYVRRFDRPGRYAYHCRPHPQMTGVVIVEP